MYFVSEKSDGYIKFIELDIKRGIENQFFFVSSQQNSPFKVVPGDFSGNAR